MPATDAAMLNFAYKYPFSSEAKEIIKDLKETKVEDKFLTAGLLRVNEALEKSKIEFVNTNYRELQYTYLVSYVYARMLASAPESKLVIAKYVLAEAARSAEALSEGTDENLLRIANQIGITVESGGGLFEIGFEQFLSAARGIDGLHLVDMRVRKGRVYLERERLLLLMKRAIEAEIMKGLPIERRNIPREVIACARGIKVKESKVGISVAGGSYSWIEKLLSIPIPDIRHRSVYLVLAPYLVNIKKMDENIAADKIIEYIERCKLLDPNTRINDTYIRYQCRYAKNKGLRPLSLTRARELFKGIVEFE